MEIFDLIPMDLRFIGTKYIADHADMWVRASIFDPLGYKIKPIGSNDLVLVFFEHKMVTETGRDIAFHLIIVVQAIIIVSGLVYMGMWSRGLVMVMVLVIGMHNVIEYAGQDRMWPIRWLVDCQANLFGRVG